MQKKKILFFGMGALGSSLYAWLKPYHQEIYAYDRKNVLTDIEKNGVLSEVYGVRGIETSSVKIVKKLKDLKDVDIIFLLVKNYDMDEAVEEIKKAYGDKPLIVSFANGVYNQELLPKHFSKVIFTVVSYNAVLRTNGNVLVADRGPLLLGDPTKKLSKEIIEVKDLLNKAVETFIPEKFEDAVYSKLTVNLTNALDTILGKGIQDPDDIGIYARLVTRNMYEGIKVIKKAGYKEVHLKSFPPFIMTWLGTWVPLFISLPKFKKKMKCLLTPSMAQDVLIRKLKTNELEYLTGHLVELGKKVGVKTPYASTILKIGKSKFGPDFKPMSCASLRDEILKTKSGK